jgi:tRNA nucleotidyltransferase (CCA-adding enzyme)
MIEKYWMHFIHDGDIGVRGVGASKDEAFEQAAIAMTSTITYSEKVEPKEAVEISCEGTNDEALFADWLNALVYEMTHRKMLFSRFDVRLDGCRLRAKVWGEKVDVARHEPALEIKGATRIELKVKQDETGMWVAQCVVDVVTAQWKRSRPCSA